MDKTLIISRTLALLLLLVACTQVMGFSARTERWTEDVALHDGRQIRVEREVEWTAEIVLTDPFFGLPTLPHISKNWPDKFHIRFKHPDTQENIVWQGEQHYRPVVLDLVDGVPYLVVYGRVTKKTEAIYGCPELPYIYLKYESEFVGTWSPVPVEKAPEELQRANLSLSYPDFGSDSRRNLSPADIQRAMPKSSGYFQSEIPRTYDGWHLKSKNSARNERNLGDCRPPPQPIPDIPIPKPTDVVLEVVVNRDYSLKYPDDFPDKTVSAVQGTITAGQCAPLFQIADADNVMLGERFVNDLTGTKKLPYTGPIPFPSGRMLEQRAIRYCNDKFIWFIAEHEEPEKRVITKYTISGDIIYNIQFTDPKTVDNKMYRGMVPNSVTTEDGYFYFYWTHELPTLIGPPAIYSHRIAKMRFKEPVPEVHPN